MAPRPAAKQSACTALTVLNESEWPHEEQSTPKVPDVQLIDGDVGGGHARRVLVAAPI